MLCDWHVIEISWNWKGSFFVLLRVWGWVDLRNLLFYWLFVYDLWWELNSNVKGACQNQPLDHLHLHSHKCEQLAQSYYMLYPIYTIKQTSSNHWANIQQMHSKYTRMMCALIARCLLGRVNGVLADWLALNQRPLGHESSAVTADPPSHKYCWSVNFYCAQVLVIICSVVELQQWIFVLITQYMLTDWTRRLKKKVSMDLCVLHCVSKNIFLTFLTVTLKRIIRFL